MKPRVILENITINSNRLIHIDEISKFNFDRNKKGPEIFRPLLINNHLYTLCAFLPGGKTPDIAFCQASLGVIISYFPVIRCTRF